MDSYRIAGIEIGEIDESISSMIYFAYAAILFLLIVKFGSPVALPELSIYPANLMEYIIFTWPPELFTAISASLLFLSSLLIIRKKIQLNFYIYSGFIVILTILSFLGFIHATCLDFPYLQTTYLLGLSTFSLFITNMFIYNRTLFIKRTTEAIFIASIVIIIYGVYQYYIGLDSTRNFLLHNIKNNRAILNSDFYNRLKENFIFSLFALTNSYGGFLVLTFPMVLWFSIHNFTKPSNKILAIIILSLYIFSIYHSGSRTAMVGFFISIVIILLLFSIKRRSSLFLYIILFVLITSFLISVTKHKGMTSFYIRFDYFYSALKLLIKEPLTGTGWGNFFFEYGKIKRIISGDAPHSPHNFFLLFASQAGIFSAILALIVMIYPLYTIWKRLLVKSKDIRKDSYLLYILAGFVPFLIHSSFDIDFQIPSLMICYIAIYVTTFDFEGRDNGHHLITAKKKLHYFIVILSTAIAIITMIFSCKVIYGRYKLFYLTKIAKTQLVDNIVNSVAKEKKNKTNLENIEKVFKSAVSAAPYSPYPYYTIAQFYAKRGYWGKTKKCLIEAIKRSPLQASYYFYLSFTNIKTGNLKSAKKNLHKAALLFPCIYKSRYIDLLKRIDRRSSDQ